MIDYKQLVQDVLDGIESPQKAIVILNSAYINVDECLKKVHEYQSKQIK